MNFETFMTAESKRLMKWVFINDKFQNCIWEESLDVLVRKIPSFITSNFWYRNYLALGELFVVLMNEVNEVKWKQIKWLKG